MGPVVAAGFWALKNMFAVDQALKSSKILITDGNHWKLVRMSLDG